VAGMLAPLRVFSTDAAAKLEGELNQNVILVNGPNNTPFCTARTNLLPIAVTQTAPFSISVTASAAPLPPGGSSNLRVRVDRTTDFKGAVTVRLLGTPPGINAGGSVTVTAQQSEATLPISAAAGAQTGRWPMAVVASGDAKGALWVSAPLEHVEIGAALLAMRVPQTAVKRGETAMVTCEVDVKTRFEGKAKLELRGLPPNTTAGDVEITAADSRAVFTVKTTATSPVGQHRTLYVAATLSRSGEPVTLNLAQNSVLRIDPPEVKP
jgi:hypothetical protein